jgi:cystathionine beta-lyase
VVRASTIIYDSVEAYMRRHDGFYDDVIYGLYGTETTYALAEAVTALEGGHMTVITSSGTAAIALGFAAFLRAGDHALVSDTVYRSTRKFCEQTLSRLGVEVTYFDPLAVDRLDEQFRPSTRVVYLESPGSLTFEMCDVRRATEIARRHGAITLMDNTWASPVLFRPIEHGVDVSIESATKYLSGHSDVMLGTLSAASREVYERLKDTAGSWGNCAGPDECYLVHRGLRTLDVRLERHQRNAEQLISWLLGQREVRRVLYPGHERDPGYVLWKRDYRGASGLFGIVLNADEKAALSLFDGLRLFKLGSSWGGYESLMVPAWPPPVRTCRPEPNDGYLIRLHAGLEDPADLIEDLKDAFSRLRRR